MSPPKEALDFLASDPSPARIAQFAEAFGADSVPEKYRSSLPSSYSMTKRDEWFRDNPSMYSPDSVTLSDANLEALGAGLVRGGRRLGRFLVDSTHIMGQKMPVPKILSDEAFAEQEKTDQPLMTQPGSEVFKGVGEAIPTFAAGGGEAAGARAATAAATKLLPRIVQAGRYMLPRTLQGGVEGGVQGAISADPGEREGSTKLGAEVGAGLGSTVGLLTRLGKGVAKKSEDALALENFATQHGQDIHIPLSQAASGTGLNNTMAAMGYRYMLPVVPGVEGQINKQGQKLQETFRTMALKEADTFNVLSEHAGRDVEDSVSKLRKANDAAYDDTIKKYSYLVPSDLRQRAATILKGVNPEMPAAHVESITDGVEQVLNEYGKLYAPSGTTALAGTNLLNAKNKLSRFISEIQDGDIKTATAAVVNKVFDDIITEGMAPVAGKANLAGNAERAADLARYKQAQEAYPALKSLERASRKAEGKAHDFTPEQLATSATDKSPVLSDLADLTHRVTKDKATNLASGSRMGGMAGVGTLAWLAGPLKAAAAVGGGNALATKGAQRAMVGDTNWQRKLLELMRDSRRTDWVRNAAVTGATAGDEQ